MRYYFRPQCEIHFTILGLLIGLTDNHTQIHEKHYISLKQNLVRLAGYLFITFHQDTILLTRTASVMCESILGTKLGILPDYDA